MGYICKYEGYLNPYNQITHFEMQIFYFMAKLKGPIIFLSAMMSEIPFSIKQPNLSRFLSLFNLVNKFIQPFSFLNDAYFINLSSFYFSQHSKKAIGGEGGCFSN